MPNRTLVRPDGSLITVLDSEVPRLLTLGYREQTPDQEREASISQGIENYYSTPGQKIATTVEGGLAGLSFGLSDLALTEEGKMRARYNPGLRLVSEVATGLATGFGALKQLTPMGRVVLASEKAGEAVGKGSRVISGLTQGAIEGGVVGTGAAITNAQINGDPITAEAIGAGLGWGAIFGGGLGALGGGAAAYMESRAARRATKEEAELLGVGVKEQNEFLRAKGEADVHSVVLDGIRQGHNAKGALEDAMFSRIWTSVDDAKTQLDEVIKGVRKAPLADAMEEARRATISPEDLGGIGSRGVDLPTTPLDELGGIGTPRQFDLPTISPGELGDITPVIRAEDEIQKAVSQIPKPKFDFRPMSADKNRLESILLDKGVFKEVRSGARAAEKALNRAIKAAGSGDYNTMAKQLDIFRERMSVMQRELGAESPKLVSKLMSGAGTAAEVGRKYADDVSRASDEVKKKFSSTSSDLEQEKALRAGIYRHQKGKLEAGSVEKDPMLSAIAKERLGGGDVGAPPAAGIAKYQLDRALQAGEEIADIAAVKSVLSGFPKTVDEFSNLSPARVEKLSAAIDKLGKLKSSELAGIQGSLKEGVERVLQDLGVTVEGTPGTQVAAMWKLLKEAKSKRAADELKVLTEGNLLWNKADKAQDKAEKARLWGDMDERKGMSRSSGGWGTPGMRSMARYAAGSWASQKLGPGGYILGASLITGLMNLKGAVISSIAEKANKWVPRAARGLQRVGPRLEPLATRIDGSEDKGEKDRRELMKLRIKEISEAAPVVRDTLYRAVEPLAIEHPELAAALHKDGVKRFQFLLSKMPKDPGLAFSGLKSLWKPDAVAVEKFARYYEVFHNPVGVMARALETGKITLEAAEGLKNMNPELFSMLRVHMLERLSDPKVQKKMKYEDQVHLGVLLDLPVHSTMDPRFISAQQQMYTERNKPLEMNPRIQPGGGAGRPSGPGPSATAGQRITEH